MQLNENIRICPQGHYYEINKHSSCPYCKKNDANTGGVSSTVDDVNNRMNEVNSQNPDDEDKTEILF